MNNKAAVFPSVGVTVQAEISTNTKRIPEKASVYCGSL